MSNSEAELAFAAAVLVKKTRLIAERAEDTRRVETGEAPLVRPPIAAERILFVTAAEEQLAAEAETIRVAERRAVLEAELAARRNTAPDTTPSSTQGPYVRFDPSTRVIPDLDQSGILPARAGYSAPGSFHDLIGVNDFLSTKRTDIELEHSSMQVISKADRLKLSASDKSKIYASFIKGSTNKFKATSTIVGLDEISTIENIRSFGELRLELQRHITSISVHPVFLILKFDHNGDLINPDTPAGAPINLLSVNSLPPLSDVEKSTLFHYKRGSIFNQENLVWSLDAVRNSCDKDLQSIIDAKMLKYKVSERFGPLYYYELVQQMTDVDSKAVRAITRELTSLKIPDLEGQSIANVASTIRSTLIWLEMVSMVPPDVDAIVYDILETCTVPDFQLYLKTLVTNASLNNVKLSYSTLLEKAENQYRTLIISKKWDASGPNGSIFHAQHQAQRTNTSSGGSSNNNRPRIVMPTWHRTAPVDGEPHERTHESKTFKWCGTCQRWFFGDRAHFTHDHIQGHNAGSRNRGRSNQDSTAPPSANAAIANSTGAATPTPAASTTATRNYMFTGGL